MRKQELRKKNLALRASLSDRAKRDEKIHRAFLNLEAYQNANIIMTYLSYKSEVDTHALISKMLEDGKTLAAPVCFENGLMDVFRFDDFESLTPSAMGILEPPKTNLVLPENIDLIIVPGCAFTEDGFRLGYGGGYYDRFLPKTNAKTCGFFYEDLKTSFTPDETDFPLNMIITEESFYRF